MKSSINNYIEIVKDIHKYKQTFGGGLVPTGTLSSGATIINRRDYNIKSTSVL